MGRSLNPSQPGKGLVPKLKLSIGTRKTYISSMHALIVRNVKINPASKGTTHQKDFHSGTFRWPLRGMKHRVPG